MLEFQDVEIKKLNVKKRKTNKTQILLYDTQRRFDDFIMKLKHRRNGKYDDIPHFCITKMGKIYKVFDPEFSSNTFDDTKLDNKQIKIAVENLGWLNNNWIGDPFRSSPFVRMWRSHQFWDVYTKEQLQALADLCLVLCVKYDIDYYCVPSSGYIENAKNINGIVSKSNFLDIYTDINPSFNFEVFFNEIYENEK
jgi:N-acetyl-anhydromuramyl-L-alanine amidase AmpD